MARTDEIEKPSWILTLASVCVVVAALYLAKGILVPLTLAVLLSFLLSPVCDWLERRKFGRVPAVIGTVFIAFALIGVVSWTAVVQIRDLAPKMPEYQGNIQTKVRSASSYVRSALKNITRATKEIGPNLNVTEEESDVVRNADGTYSVRVIPDPPSPLQLVSGMFESLISALATAGVVLILVVFFLIRREDLRDRFIRLFGRGQVTLTTQALEDATTRVSRYLAMQLLINVTYGLPVAIGLYFIGVPNAMLWGILATVLRFIPYIGPWIAAVIPIALSMAISQGWGPPVQTIAMFLILELFSNNVMEPWLYGKNTGVSPVAVLVAAIFWSWLWGPIGLLLATPLTVCLLVIGKHVPLLSFLDVLLGDEPVFEPKTRVYQRLLAGDQEEAAEVVDELVAQMPLVEVYDSVLIPVMASIETRRISGEVDPARCKFMIQSVRELVEDQDQRLQEPPAEMGDEVVTEPETVAAVEELTESAKRCILCVPARSEADDIAAMMLAQVLQPSGSLVQAVSFTSRIKDVTDLIKQLKADVVCISATAPAALMHARAMTKQLRLRFPNLHLVVGLWGMRSELTKAKERIGGGARTYVVGRIADVQEQIGLVLPQPIVESTKQVRADLNSPVLVPHTSGVAKPHVL